MVLTCQPTESSPCRLPGSHRLRPRVPAMFDYDSDLSLGGDPTHLPVGRPTPAALRSGRPFGAVWFGLLPVRSPLLGGIHLFSSPYLDVSVRAEPSTVPTYSARGATPYRVAGCPIRRSSDHGLVPAPRRLSQLPTSFFGTRRQGIHRMLVLPSSSVPRLTKQPCLIAWMRIRCLHHVPGLTR